MKYFFLILSFISFFNQSGGAFADLKETIENHSVGTQYFSLISKGDTCIYRSYGKTPSINKGEEFLLWENRFRWVDLQSTSSILREDNNGLVLSIPSKYNEMSIIKNGKTGKNRDDKLILFLPKDTDLNRIHQLLISLTN